MALFKKGIAPLPLKRVRFDLGNDCYINLRELTSQELIQFQKQFDGKDTSNIDFIYSLVAKCACDDEGKAVFENADDVRTNFDVGISTLIDIQKKIMEISGIDTPKN